MVKKIQINFSNKWLYTFVAVGVLILLGVGVYAYGGSSPRIMGHSVSEIAPPTGCSSGQVLQWDGNSWGCAEMIGSGRDGTTVVQSKQQCPPRRVIVDESSNGWDEWAYYETCEVKENYLILDETKISDNGKSYYIYTYNCPQFCKEFGFFGGTLEGGKDCLIEQESSHYYAFFKTDNPYDRGQWKKDGYSLNLEYLNSCTTCKCYI